MFDIALLLKVEMILLAYGPSKLAIRGYIFLHIRIYKMVSYGFQYVSTATSKQIGITKRCSFLY